MEMMRSMAKPNPLVVSVEVDDLVKSFSSPSGSFLALNGLRFQAYSGEFVTIIGPSGCGKSTLFNIICGVAIADEGRVRINGEEIKGGNGDVGYMPQKDLLLPWRTVLDNAVLGMEVAGISKRAAIGKARLLLEEFGLGDVELAYPHTLSGGMRQRLAFLRTVLYQKNVLLLDEPFGALDALTRSSMHDWLLKIWERMHQTILFVTHDVEEAVLLSDRVYVMSRRPGFIKAEIQINLPRPRHHDLIVNKKFLDYKMELLDSLKIESEEF